MRETLSARLRHEWHEAKCRLAKWIIRKAVQWHDRLNEKAFMAYNWALDEITDYHVIAERSYHDCHVYGTKVEYYDAPEEVAGMTDREKVIKELTEIHDEAYDRWVHRPYIEDKLVTLIRDCIPDALVLLVEQDTVEHAIKVLRAHGWKDETEVSGDE